jgi:hypothetical protein
MEIGTRTGANRIEFEGTGPAEDAGGSGGGHLRQRQLAAQLAMSERGFRKLLQRYRTKRDAAVCLSRSLVLEFPP